MRLLIWIVGLIVLMLWSATVWLGYSITHIALTLPWQQGAAALGQLQIPDVLKPFIDPILLIFAGGSWTAWAKSLEPLIQWLGNLLQGSASWLTAALPVMAWLLWGIGALFVIVLITGASAALWWWRKRSLSSGGSGNVGSDSASLQQMAQHPLVDRIRRKLFG